MTQQIAIIADRLEQLPGIRLKSGAHYSFNEGACVMEAVAWVAGERWSDHPECACPVITAFLQSWNDALPNDAERDRLLMPLVMRVIGTRGDAKMEKRRAMMAADWYIRVQAPAWLRLAGLTKQSDDLASLPEITDFLTCPSLMPVLNAVRDDASAAESAAESAAWAATESAAESAARSALDKTRLELQQSALELVNRMIDLSAAE